MKTTYYIETISDGVLQYYYDTLYSAKYDLVKMYKPECAKIVCLKGPYKYEGYHAYKLTYVFDKNRKPRFKRI
jgi:hypothetical protein